VWQRDRLRSVYLGFPLPVILRPVPHIRSFSIWEILQLSSKMPHFLSTALSSKQNIKSKIKYLIQATDNFDTHAEPCTKIETMPVILTLRRGSVQITKLQLLLNNCASEHIITPTKGKQ
jgi:hypothetical protein